MPFLGFTVLEKIGPWREAFNCIFDFIKAYAEKFLPHIGHIYSAVSKFAVKR